MRRLIFVLTMAGSVFAQSVPVVGWVEAGGQLRPLTGLPGSTRAGAPVAAAERALVSPGGQAALIELDGTARLVDLSDGQVRLTLELAAPPRLAAFASDGSAGALLMGSRLELYTGLPSKPVRLWQREVNGVTAVAVSAGGRRVAVWADEGVQLVAADSATGLYAKAGVGSLRWAGENSLVIFDRDAGRVMMLDQVESPAPRLLLESVVLDGEVSADGRRLFVAVAQAVAQDAAQDAPQDAGAKLTTIELATGQVMSETSVAVAQIEFRRLGRGDLFLLAAPRDDGPGWMLDGAAGRVTFLPALRVAEEQ